VARVTAAKLDAALARLQRRGWASAPVLCSDTTVAVEQRILGKPLDEADALATLQLLSGRRHRVITAVAVADGAKRWQTSSISHVDVAAVPTAALQRYIASGEPFGKAGSYAIQSLASAWISRIDGSYSGIMGLPLFETAQLLSNCGFEF